MSTITQEFITEILTKFGLPKETHVDLKDSSGIDVDSDIFDELVKSSQVSFVVSTEESSGDVLMVMSAHLRAEMRDNPSESSFCSGDSASSGSTLILESTKARRRQLIDGPVDLTTARDIVKVALHSKPGGDQIFQEYHKTCGLSDGTRRKMVNILVADMVEGHGRISPVNVRISYALGIITLFPHLKDLDSVNGYVAQDFTLRFGEEVSGRFLAKWPTIFKPKIIADCKTIHSNSQVDDLLALALQESDHAFDELFKAHFVFAVSYDEALNNFFTFIQTTVYGIDVGKAKESPRVKEIRVRLLRRDL
ncbi:hypothetical protein SRHO_G00112920 [Serrasalmus rhombeus]